MISIQNENFKSYLAGLFEGDGSFIVPPVLKDSKNRLRYPKLKVAFHINDKPLALRLQACYGGHFENYKHHVVWNVTRKDQILLICSHINGRLRTPKINDFIKLINFMKNKDSLIEFEVLPLDESPINSNAWLAGFSDANSNFFLSIVKRKNNKKRIQLQFRIEVKQFYGKGLIKNSENFSSFTPICNTIAEFLGLGIYHRTRNKKHHMILIVSTSVQTNSKVVQYFNNFSLLSSKYLNYIDWKTVHEMQKKKLHLTTEGLKVCENIKSNFNTTRNKFSWDHLDNFYL